MSCGTEGSLNTDTCSQDREYVLCYGGNGRVDMLKLFPDGKGVFGRVPTQVAEL